MPANTAEETHRLLMDAFNRRDVDALIDLYEDGAVFLTQPGAPLARGTAGVREAIRAFVGMNGTFDIERTDVVAAADVAVVYSTWTLKGGSDPNGNPIDLAGQTTDVVRRQPDGTWLFAIDNPWGVQAFAPAPTTR
jgi:ketosteroid isomerase-like protein